MSKLIYPQNYFENRPCVLAPNDHPLLFGWIRNSQTKYIAIGEVHHDTDNYAILFSQEGISTLIKENIADVFLEGGGHESIASDYRGIDGEEHCLQMDYLEFLVDEKTECTRQQEDDKNLGIMRGHRAGLRFYYVSSMVQSIIEALESWQSSDPESYQNALPILYDRLAQNYYDDMSEQLSFFGYGMGDKRTAEYYAEHASSFLEGLCSKSFLQWLEQDLANLPLQESEKEKIQTIQNCFQKYGRRLTGRTDEIAAKKIQAFTKKRALLFYGAAHICTTNDANVVRQLQKLEFETQHASNVTSETYSDISILLMMSSQAMDDYLTHFPDIEAIRVADMPVVRSELINIYNTSTKQLGKLPEFFPNKIRAGNSQPSLRL